MRLIRNALSALLFVLLLPQTAFGQISDCPFPDLLPCSEGGIEGAASDFLLMLYSLDTLFYALCIVYFGYYALRLVAGGEDANTQSEIKSAYGYGVAGVVIMFFAGRVLPSLFIKTDIGFNPDALIGPADSVVAALRILIAPALFLFLGIRGFRLVTKGATDSELEDQKKNFFHALMGVSVIILANVVVNAFFPGVGSSQLVTEIAGIAAFLLEILGALAVLSFIVAGIFLIISADESLKDRAKKTMFNTIIVLLIILAARAIVAFVLAPAGG